MIIDLARFIDKEKPQWTEFESMLDAYAHDAASSWTIETAKRFYTLYEKVSSDLVKLTTFSGERELRLYLGTLVARGYAAIHTGSARQRRFNILQWVRHGFPAAFRRTFPAFCLSALITLFGCIFGGTIVMVDSDAKDALFPRGMDHLRQTPAERVAQEENASPRHLGDQQGAFAAYLVTHNIRVSLLALALGMTWAIGTVLLLFYNGVILGAVIADYAAAGFPAFVTGWLLPHGIIEIPAILIAGQAGLLLGDCLLRPGGMSRRAKLAQRLPDIVSLVGGVALLLAWAALVESFFSQYHGSVLPYWFKIAFGMAEGLVLVLYLGGGLVPARRRP